MGANAQTSVPTFTAGEILTAANMNISARTGIPVFATSTTRDAAFGGTGEKTLAEGQFAYLEDSNTTQYYDGAAWKSVGASKIVQVLSTAKTNTFTTTSTSFTDITGLSVAITPTVNTSTILVMFTIQGSATANKTGYIQLVRDSTAIGIGDAAGNRSRSSVLLRELEDNVANTGALIFLDSPATTSAITYKLQGRTESASTLFINRDNVYTDAAAYSTECSTITVMEILA